jgi:CRISPR system Cascade subunit CasB
MDQPNRSEGPIAPVAGAGKVDLRDLVNRIARDIDQALGTGDVAELRRIRAHDIGQPAFWRIVATHLDPAGALPTGEEARDEAERRWAVILATMAMLRGLHRPGRRLGHALVDAGVTEMRLLRLLRAHGEVLADAVRVTVHQLAQPALQVDVSEIARLVLSDGRSDEERVRRRVARDYFSASYHTRKETES